METREREELRLITKKKRGFGRILFSRTGAILLLLLIFMLGYFWVIFNNTIWVKRFVVLIILLHIGIIVEMISNDMDSTAKITWLLVVSAFPLTGAFLYIYTRLDLESYLLRKKFGRLKDRNHELLEYDKEALRGLKAEAPDVAALCRYVADTGNYPVYNGNKVDYYELGEYKWAALLDDLEKAEKFIFLEYFIIGEGKMWGQMLKILADKAAKGVEVRVIYDGTNVISNLPQNYHKKLQKLGIKCHVFAPLRPPISTVYNNRDHRKILVIDGKVAYNGGVNLADEYINEIVRFGHWKDTAVRIEGPAVDSFTAMFLEMWLLEEEPEKTSQYFVNHKLTMGDSTGYVMPFADNPLDKDKAGENVYLDFLYRAKDYVHIMTPYLILDDVMITALTTTARKGIDVELIVPGIPDKKRIYTLTRSYFERLMEAGVKIYTYTPGFVHAKVFVSDDCKASVGTINLDYRSLYHHFECATYLYNVPCISQIKKDFIQTREKCHLVTMEEIKAMKLPEEIGGAVLRTIAPLL